MVDTSRIRNGLAVIALDAEPVGIVDAVDGDRLKLTRRDAADNSHHDIPLAWIDRVDERVHLSRTGAEVRASWAPQRAARRGKGARKINWVGWLLLGIGLLALLWVLSR